MVIINIQLEKVILIKYYVKKQLILQLIKHVMDIKEDLLL